MNHCVLTGNLGEDPKEFYTPDGVAIASFQLAFRSGKDKTSWIRVSCYQKVAEVALRCLHKGAKIAVNGVLDQQRWSDEHQNPKTGYRMIANQIEFIKTDGRGFNKEAGADADAETQGASAHDDVPF